MVRDGDPSTSPTSKPPAPTSAKKPTSPSSKPSSPSPGDQIADRYLPTEQRPEALTTLDHLTRDLIRRTEDGSHPDLRLTAVRHYIDTTTRTGTLHGWLADNNVPGGPDLDPELRWRILKRLAVLGAVDDTHIAAELDRDPSATGQEGAARCRAALPTPEAKAAAWERMFHEDTLSNYLFTATARGFWQPEQLDLLQPYVTRYYPEATALAARRGPPSPPQPAATPSPATPSPPRTSASATNTSPTPTSPPPSTANSPTDSTTSTAHSAYAATDTHPHTRTHREAPRPPRGASPYLPTTPHPPIGLRNPHTTPTHTPGTR